MASPLKTFVLRMPSSPAGLTSRCCPRATLTTTARPVSLPQSPFRPNRPSITPKLQQLRAKSDQASAAQKTVDANKFKTGADLASKRPSSQTPNSSATPALDWNTFFKLRLRRRRIQVFFSVTSSMVVGVAGVGLLSTGAAEPLVSQIPLDPFISLGMLTFAFAGVGWLAGPSIGSQVFYLMNRRFKGQINQKEAEFFARIKKNRVDPTNSSAANPVPDFYGEKIQSVKGYRDWLKDQRAFNKKKSANLI